MKILVIKPSSLGDVIHALPVLRFLKRHLPSSQIYWFIDEHLAPLLENDPDLDGLFVFARQGWQRPTRWMAAGRQIQSLRGQHFDWVIDLQSLARSALIAWLANGQFTVGLDDPREGASVFYDLAVPRPSPHTHAVDWYLSVLTALRIPHDRPFTWLPTRPQIAARVREQRPEGARRLVILQPGARWPNKRWPVEHFAELIYHLQTWNRELYFAVLGGVNDQKAGLGRVIADAAPDRCLDLSGRLSLGEMIEWIRSADLMVSNDTGPLHVAVALGKPVVALYGPTEPKRTGPYGQLDHVLQLSLPCVPCMKSTCHYERPLACLRELSPARVAAAVVSVMQG